MTLFLVMGAIILVLWIAISLLCFKLSSVLGKYSKALVVISEMLQAGVSVEASEIAQQFTSRFKKKGV